MRLDLVIMDVELSKDKKQLLFLGVDTSGETHSWAVELRDLVEGFGARFSSEAVEDDGA